MFRVCSVIVGLALSQPAWADISGRIEVIDGDTFDVGGVRVRLHGIDAPEIGQPCRTDAGRALDCGAWVRDEVLRRYGGVRATCDPIELDRYGRTVAKCYAGGDDIGARLVEDGLAFAFRRYSMDYDLAEKQASVADLGLWSVTVQAPAAWRDQPAAPPRDCTIKGNISANGQIYHVPGQEHYDRTRIDEARGERWFCSEAEAREAGWRAARR